MPFPKQGEDKKTYMARCMGDAGMLKEAPGAGQRYILCKAHWDKGPKQMSGACILAAGASEFSPALVMDTMPKEVNGLKAHYFWRRATCDGTYMHPVKGFVLDIDAKRRRQLEDNFREMTRAGVKVPVVKDHKETTDATLGYVVDMRQRGSWLEELHQYLGDEAKDIALKNQISVGIDPDFADGKGRKYGEAIRHSATTPIPVVPGAGDVSIAAARTGPAEILVLTLAASIGVLMSLTTEQVAAVKDLIGKDVTAENGFDELLSWANGIKPKVADLQTKMTTLSAAQAELATAKQKIIELSAAAPKQTDPDVLEDRAETIESGLETCVERHAVTPPVRDKLKALLAGAKGSRNVFMLSRSANGEIPAREIVNALKENKPIAMGGRMPTQLSAAEDDPTEMRKRQNALVAEFEKRRSAN